MRANEFVTERKKYKRKSGYAAYGPGPYGGYGYYAGYSGDSGEGGDGGGGESIKNEALDQPYKLRWEKGDKDIDAIARMDDGKYLSIMFNKGFSQDTKEEAWSVEFYRDNSQEVTGEGDEFRVFATVLSAIQTFISDRVPGAKGKYKPNKVYFSASKEVEPGQNAQSRAGLYDSLVQRYAKALGFRAFRADTGNKVIYELTRIKPIVAKPVAEGEVVPLGKKHRGDLDSVNSCSRCGGKLQGGTYMGQRIKVCQPCKQVYLPPNSGIDQQGNKIKEQGVAEGATVTRIDSKPITDFASSLKAYKHTDDWSQSGVDTGDDSYWKNKNLKTNTTKGLFAGDPKRTALYATGNAHETRYVEFTQDGQPIVYFDRKDLPAMRSRKTYLTVFDANDFRQLPTGEWFSENPSKPIKQGPIGDPFKYIASQGWIVRVTDDLDKVFKQVKKMHKAGKIAQYGAEGMNESKQGVAENFADGKNPQDKGDSKRHGVPTKASVSTLRKVAKQGGRKGQLAHWMANMKSGRSKKK